MNPHTTAAHIRAQAQLSAMDALIAHGRATEADKAAIRREVAMRVQVMDAMRSGTDDTLRGDLYVWREYMLAHALYEARWASGEWDDAQFHAAARALLVWRDDELGHRRIA